MKLSIIIVNFNTKEQILDCLASINTQEYEVIVVDNASTDGSIAAIKKAQPNISLLINKDNVGFAKANNQGIIKTHGKYVLLLNPDTILKKETLPYLLDYMDKNTQVGVVTCKVVLPSGEIDDASHRGFPTPWRALTHFLGLGRLFPQSYFFNGYHLGYRSMDSVHEIDAGVGAFLLIRRSVGEQVGWLDEDYFWYGEDLDFCFKVKHAGFKIMYIPNVSITHYKGVASGLKKHSQHLSKADLETKKRATKARFAVMRIFYEKHYKTLYPRWLTQLVLWGIACKQKYTELRLR